MQNLDWKYRIKENIRTSPVPIVELNPGEEGYVSGARLYSTCSVLYFGERTIILDSSGKYPKIEDWDDKFIESFSEEYKCPIDELRQLSEIVKLYKENPVLATHQSSEN